MVMLTEICIVSNEIGQFNKVVGTVTVGMEFLTLKVQLS